ncbi:hypothetical protein HYT23_05590 [Candidatus Pacearchaeota archaeon]|nr:hypothetical protein [Candidatus Pacearchaeota archaeon]
MVAVGVLAGLTTITADALKIGGYRSSDLLSEGITQDSNSGPYWAPLKSCGGPFYEPLNTHGGP